MTANLGTVAWSAPEMFGQGEMCGHYSEKIDVYSYGMCLWEMVTRQIPFAGRTPLQVGTPPRPAAPPRPPWVTRARGREPLRPQRPGR